MIRFGGRPAVLYCCWCFVIATAVPTIAAPPNVVLINIDDMGWADIGAYDPANRIDTPHMDQLAADGIRFTNFYVSSPICSPSRCGLYTGMYPARWRIHSFISGSHVNRNRDMVNFLSLDAPFIARMFKEAGYRTANVGKWHLGAGRDVGYDVPPYNVYGQLEAPLITEYGFDESFTQFEGLGDRQLYNGQGLSNQSAALENNCCPPEAGPYTITFGPKRYSTANFVDRAIQFINDTLANDPNQPFFVNFPLDDVHSQFDPFPTLKAKYDALYPNLPNRVRAYMAVTENMDSELGRLIAHIDGLGLAEETLFILTADNGPESQNTDAGSTAHLRGMKRSLYEGGIREPLILRWKDTIAPGQVNDQTVVAATDLFPSLAAIVGGKLPDEHDLDGLDMSTALLGQAQPTRLSPVFWEFGWNANVGRAPGIWRAPNLAMRIGDWKFLVEDDGTGAELYNLADDESETTNLANQRPELVAKLKRTTLAWRYSLPAGVPPAGALIAHLRAESLGAADGAAVANWADAAGSDSFNASLSQAEAARQPTKRAGGLNGLAVVDFDGDDVLLSSTANALPAADDGYTLFLVTTGDSSGGKAKRVAQIGSSAGAAGRIVGVDASSSSATTNNGGSGLRFNNGAALYDTALANAGDFHIVVVQVDDEQAYDQAIFYVDGTTPQRTFTGTSNNPTGVLNLSGNDLELLLGNGRATGGALYANDFFTGSVAELLIYNEQMSVDEINLVASYLANQYDLPFDYQSAGPIPTWECLAGPGNPLPPSSVEPPPASGTDVLCIEVSNGGQLKHYHVEEGVWTFQSDFITAGTPRGFDQDPNSGTIWTIDLGGPLRAYNDSGAVIASAVGQAGVDYTDQPEFLELDDVGNLYMPTGPGGSDKHIICYSPQTDTFIDQFIPTTDGENYTFSDNIRDVEVVGNRLFVADKNNHRLIEFRTDTGAFVQFFDDVDVPLPSAIEYDAVGDRLLVSVEFSGVGARSDDLLEYRGIAGRDGQAALSKTTLIDQETDNFNIHGIMVLDGVIYVTNQYNVAGVRQGVFSVDSTNNRYVQVVSDAEQTTVLNAVVLAQPEPEGCAANDFDGDGDVDLHDIHVRMQLE